MKPDTLRQLQAVCANFAAVASQIREETDQIVSMGDHIALIRHFNDLRLANDEIKTAREALKDIADMLSTSAIPDLLRRLKEEVGLKTPINLEGVGRVTVSYRFSCTMLDKPKGIGWLDANGHGAMAQRTVNAQTLGAFAKDMLEVKGMELPPDLFKTGTAPYTSITKA
jgi:hypothetical protein